MDWTEEQKKAIEAATETTAVLAGAGSGKTKVLIERILKLLQSDEADLSQIVAITYTEKAAAELKQRLAKALPEETLKDIAFAPIGTFHSFFSRVLSEHAPLLGLPFPIQVLDENETRLLIYQTCRASILNLLETGEESILNFVEEFDFRETLSLLTRLLQFRWHAEKHLKKATEPIFKTILSLYEKVKTTYDLHKEELGRLDFQDLEIFMLQLLEKNPVITKELQLKYRYFLIDEYQDVNDLQDQIVSKLTNPEKNKVFIVGDPKQSIYRFRGANVQSFQTRIEKMKEKKYPLFLFAHNFRSDPSILNFLNHLFKPLFTKTEYLPLIPGKMQEKDFCAVSLLPFQSEKKGSENLRVAEAEILARYIQGEVATKKRTYQDFALLFQSLTQVRFYEKTFRGLGIPYRLHGGSSFLSRQEVIDMIFCMKLAVDSKDKLSLTGILRSPLSGLSDAEIFIFFKQGKTSLEDYLEHPQCHLLKFLAQEAKKLDPRTLLEEVLRRSHYDWFVNQLDPTGMKLANIEQLMALAKEAALSHQTTADFVLFLEELEKRQAPLSEASTVDIHGVGVKFMTVHAAKGLQFPVVLLPDLWRNPRNMGSSFLFLPEEGIAFKKRPEGSPFEKMEETEEFTKLKKIESAESEEEKKRLLYVATTRAQEELIFPWCKDVERSGLWYQWVQNAIQSYPDLKALVPAATTGNQGTRITASLPPLFIPPKKSTEEKYYTVTQLEVFERSKEEYRKRYIEKRIEDNNISTQLTAADWGNIVHTLIKEYRPQENLDVSQRLKKKIKDFGWIVDPEEEKKWENRLKLFFESKNAPRHWEGDHEVPFRLQFEGASIGGILDYIGKTDKGWILYDFKTDQKIEPEDYRLQMDIYALALASVKKEPLLETRLLYITPNEEVVWPVNEKRFSQTRKKMETLLAKLDAEHRR